MVLSLTCLYRTRLEVTCFYVKMYEELPLANLIFERCSRVINGVTQACIDNHLAMLSLYMHSHVNHVSLRLDHFLTLVT